MTSNIPEVRKNGEVVWMYGGGIVDIMGKGCVTGSCQAGGRIRRRFMDVVKDEGWCDRRGCW